MLGVTISLGSVATGLVTNQFGITATTAGAGAMNYENSAGIQLSYVLATTTSAGGCPTYRGVPGGNVLQIIIYDYGSRSFSPTTIVVNSTLYFSPTFPTVAAGGMVTYRLSLTPAGICAHPWGQTVLMADVVGDDFQFET